MSGVEIVAVAKFLMWSYAAANVAKAATSASQHPNAEPSQGIKLNLRRTTAVLPVVYGEMKIGGNDVVIEETFNESDEEEIWIVQTLAEGECQGIKQIGGVDQVFIDGKLPSEFGGNVEYWFVPGNATQDYASTPGLSHLYAANSQYTDNYRHTALIVWHLTFNQDYFMGIPERQVVLQGRKLYDFRDTTTAYDTNHVLAAYDFLTSSRYGLGIPAAKIDTTSWTSAANYVDTKGWKLNHIISSGNAYEILQWIFRLFRGQIVPYADKIYARYADLNYESSLMTITDEHIVQDNDGRAMIKVSQPGKYSKPDAIAAWYIDPDKEYAEDCVMIGDDSGVIEEVKYYGSTDRQHVADLAVYHLERLQLDRVISGTFRDDCQKLEPHDVITFSSTALSISDQLMRVESSVIRPDGLVDLALIYEDSTLYDDDYNLDTEGVYTCNLPDKDMAVPSVSNVEVAEEYYANRQRSETRLKITFDPPANYPWYSHVEVWVSNDDVTYTHQFPTDSDFYIEPVKEGQSIYVRLKTVSIHGRKTADNDDYKVYRVITGVADVPDSVGSLEAIVNQNSINLYAARLESDDIELYEFRLGATWNGAIFLSALRAPNLSLVGVKPGSHTFMVNTLSTNGNYGDTPRSKSATLVDPPDGWSVTNTETCDYDGIGTHDNTEHTTYSSDDYLKCSHTGGVLTGTYTSPVYDLGASGRYLVYALAAIVVTGTGTTWDDQMPSPTTWDQVNASTRSWNEIFAPSAAPQVRMKLLYGDTNPPTNEVEMMEILSAIVTARYFQLEIEITDPSSELNALVENFTLKFCQ